MEVRIRRTLDERFDRAPGFLKGRRLRRAFEDCQGNCNCKGGQGRETASLVEEKLNLVNFEVTVHSHFSTICHRFVTFYLDYFTIPNTLAV